MEITLPPNFKIPDGTKPGDKFQCLAEFEAGNDPKKADLESLDGEPYNDDAEDQGKDSDPEASFGSAVESGMGGPAPAGE